MNETKYSSCLIVAPSSYDECNGKVDYMCKGKNDELVIQKALLDSVKLNKNVFLINGIYHIDKFYDFGDGGPLAALSMPNAHREIKLLGENHEYGIQGSYDNGVVLEVSKEALDTIDGEVDVLRTDWCFEGIQDGVSVNIENICIVLANNEHPLRCIDLRRADRVEVKNVSLIGYGEKLNKYSKDKFGWIIQPDLATKGCIGLTMTDGSNYNYSNYTNVHAWGFDEGIQVGGEHVVAINCGATHGRYGFTFGNYKCHRGLNHPITLINCLDERNVNLPLFGVCGDDGGDQPGEQEVSLISFNFERLARQTPGGKLGQCMRELVPGTWKGNISFTLQPDWNHVNAVDCQIWENDGSGCGILTRNNCHKTVCSTKERLSYYPTYGQTLFDTDLNKMVICIDPEKKIWVDMIGNKI